MAAPHQLFKFDPPKLCSSPEERFSRASFSVRADSILHGFALFLECQLYKDIKVSNLQLNAAETQGMAPVFLPLVTPVQLVKDDKLEVEVWRIAGPRRLW